MNFSDIGWLVHDCLVHPVTGAIGFFGRVIRSPRIVALSMHAHNASAPSNDAWADLGEAAARASHNETGRVTTKVCFVCASESHNDHNHTDDHGLFVEVYERRDNRRAYRKHKDRNGNPCPMSGLPTDLTEEEQLSMVAPARKQAELVAAMTSGPVLSAIVEAVVADLARRGLVTKP